MSEGFQTPPTSQQKPDFIDRDVFNHLSSNGLTSDGKLRDESPFKKEGSPFLAADDLRSLTASPFSDIGQNGYNLAGDGGHLLSGSQRITSPQTWKAWMANRWRTFWTRNSPVVLVALAQLFGALMNLAARLLELEGEGMHPFQILFVRMSITAALAMLYMWRTKVPHFPLGPPEVRWLLVARGLTGFFGIYGMWYSMLYLPLSEATVVTFLAPSLAGYICHLILKDPFTRKEQLASFVALAGVVFIARPTSLFSGPPVTEAPPEAPPTRPGNFTQSLPHIGSEPTPSQRLLGIGVALIGVLGAAGAFTMIRWIGKRAHPLLSVNYFAVWCTLVSTVVLTAAPLMDIGQPAIRFALPASLRQWCLLLFLGMCGFVMQFLLTSGLRAEKSNRATAMVYTHMLFAAGFDRWVFGHEMGIVSLIGCGLIIGSALWVALTKKEERKGEQHVEAGATTVVEAVPMLREDDEDEEEEGIPLEHVR